jgi:hypothetical protein
VSSPAAVGATAAAIATVAVALVACAGAGDAGRDVVPESRDVIADAGAHPGSDEGYEYIARRPLAVVALAEARGIDAAVARAAIDRLADRLDACVTEGSRGGKPVTGAARVIAQIDPGGAVSATRVRIDPGAGDAPSAVVCLVSPMKLLTFPPADGAGPRGLAVEAIWGRVAPTP